MSAVVAGSDDNTTDEIYVGPGDLDQAWGGGGEGPQPEDVLRTADALMEAGL